MNPNTNGQHVVDSEGNSGTVMGFPIYEGVQSCEVWATLPGSRFGSAKRTYRRPAGSDEPFKHPITGAELRTV